MKLVLLSALCLLLCCPAWAKDAVHPKYVKLPLLYITDRDSTAKGFGGNRILEKGASIYNLHFGSVDCTAANSQCKNLSDEERRLGWTDSHAPVPIAIHPDAGSGTDKAFDEFGKTVTEAVEKSGSKEVFVIVHGFNMKFTTTVKSAAALAYQVKRPVIIYDWPSKGRLGGYDVDAGNNEWSQEHFDRFVEELKEIKNRTGIKFNLLAHSMGNRLVIRSATVIKVRHIFDQIYLVDPDFDAETFVHYLIRFTRNNEELDKERTAGGEKIEPTKIRILFSHKDRALPLAQFVFGGYTRLGQAADTMLSIVFNPLALAESQVNSVKEILSDEKSKPMSELNAAGFVKFEWIDFTSLDRGIIGHTIPYQLIANLCSTNTPGDGLQLLDSSNSTPNRLTRLFLGVFHQKQHISSKLGSCKRVVSVKEADSLIDNGQAATAITP